MSKLYNIGEVIDSLQISHVGIIGSDTAGTINIPNAELNHLKDKRPFLLKNNLMEPVLVNGILASQDEKTVTSMTPIVLYPGWNPELFKAVHIEFCYSNLDGEPIEHSIDDNAFGEDTTLRIPIIQYGY